MTAVLIETATEEDWLAARRRGITASEIAALLGVSPYTSPYALYHQKLGVLAPEADSDVMERGRVLEPYIADKFAAARPDLMVAGTGRELFRHADRPWQMATPDRLLCEDMRLDFDGDRVIEELEPAAVLECKVDGGSDEWGEPGTDEIPVHYRAQVLWQCDVISVQRWYVACLRARDWKLCVYTGEIDAAAGDDLALMRSEARIFLDRLEAQDAPGVDWHPATSHALRTLYAGTDDTDVVVGRQLAISYRAAVRRAEQAGRRKEEMTNRLLAAIRDGRRAVEARTGVPVATRSAYPQKRISTSMVRDRYPAIAAECEKTSTVIKLLPAKQKKEKKECRRR